MQITASLGVAVGNAGANVSDIAERALAALATAKCSGRDCVVRDGDFECEGKAWQDLAAPGRVFERTTARDVMLPCCVSLTQRDSTESAAALFRQTTLAAIPVVTDDGVLSGVLWREDVLDNANAAVDSEVPKFEDTTDFSELLEFFGDQQSPFAMIVADARPIGFVTPDSLGAPSQPLMSDTFATADSTERNPHFFAVPEMAALAD